MNTFCTMNKRGYTEKGRRDGDMVTRGTLPKWSDLSRKGYH